MRYSDWEILSVLYETKNITKTAGLTFMTQSTLTRRIQQIEEELGTVLILRSNKGVTFTSEGICAALKGREILRMIADIKANVSQSGKDLRGTLRLGTPKSYIYFVIPRLLKDFYEEFPSVRIEIHTDLSHELLKNLESKQLDVSFVRGDIYTTLKKELLSENQIYILAKEPFAIEDLPRMTLLPLLFSLNRLQYPNSLSSALPQPEYQCRPST